MTAQRGKDFLLKIDEGGSVFSTVAGMRSKRIAFNTETVDVTNAQSAGRWRELLDGCGMQRASVSGSGIFKDASSDELLRTAFFNSQTPQFQIVIPDFGVITGAFQIVSLEYTGNYNNEINFDISLESAGVISFGGV